MTVCNLWLDSRRSQVGSTDLTNDTIMSFRIRSFVAAWAAYRLFSNLFLEKLMILAEVEERSKLATFPAGISIIATSLQMTIRFLKSSWLLLDLRDQCHPFRMEFRSKK